MNFNMPTYMLLAQLDGGGGGGGGAMETSESINKELHFQNMI